MPKLNRTTGKTTHARRRSIQNTDATISGARRAGNMRGLRAVLGLPPAKPTGKSGRRGK